ncbi:MAG: hypothetical protein E7624_05200 [Ruminococcaceae bacterium]|nr:hypothetical protein [Oscillospiraceae bacterium]
MINKSDKLNLFFKLSREISELESSYDAKKKEVEQKYNTEFSSLERELGIYISKIKPTVDTVCNLYKSKILPSGNKISLHNGTPLQEYNFLNAYEVALKCGQESVAFLSFVIKRINIDTNLYEFALRYNTVVQIYENIKNLTSQAIKSSLKEYQDNIDALNAKRNAICKSKKEFNDMVSEIITTSDTLHRKTMIEAPMEIEKKFVPEISLSVGYEVDEIIMSDSSQKNQVITSLLNWELHKSGIMVIKTTEKDIDTAELSVCAVNTVIKFLFSYPSTNKQLLLCDSRSSNAVTTFAGILKNGNAALFFDNAHDIFVKNTGEEIRNSLAALNKIINQRIMLLGQSRCSNVLEYNYKNQDNPQPIILVLLNGYPSKYENAYDEITSALKNGQAAGVFFLITENTHTDEDTKYQRRYLPELESMNAQTVEFKIINGKGILLQNGVEYLSNTCGDGYDINAILSAFKVEIKRDTNKVIYLDSVVEKEDFKTSPRRTKYSKVLSIPFGKQGSNPISVNLSADGPEAHLALIGTTGSGKTAFINSLILSASKLYSPAELELHLIVMVKGDFKIFEEEKLPHLKTVVTGDRIFAANDVLDLIDGEMKRRGDLIGSHGNIYAYNEVAEAPLPRCMIIIDEFYQLVQDSSEAVSRINRIAQVGRAYGISLVISSIKFPAEVNSIIALFGNRIEFKAHENAGQLIPHATNRQPELEKIKGSCFFACGGNLHSVRTAYSEEGEKLKHHIEEIKAKYPEYKMELQSNIRAVRIAKESDVPFAVRCAKSNYSEEGVIRMRLGKTYLSSTPLEYPFDSKNNLLFLFGHYLDTKMMEASLIKDTIVLSKGIEGPVVYYIDYNKNAFLKRNKTVIKRMLDPWLLSGKMSYIGSDGIDDAFEDIQALIKTREEDDECELYPILVLIAKADEIFKDDDLCEALCDLITSGKENNVYFAIQCSEPIKFFRSEKYLHDAIIFPDRYNEEEDSYSSSALCAALEAMPAGASAKGKKLIYNASTSALDHRLHILCNDNKISIFVPYEYDEEYLKNIVD